MNKLPELDVDVVRDLSAESGVEIKIVSVESGEIKNLAQVSQGGINVITDEYEGPYEATPTQSTQTFPTKDKGMAQDFVVNPIPSNYGLITWNGSVLTVS